MIKNFKTVSMMLLLGSMSTGLTHAAFETSVAGTNVVQQNNVCKGIVKDANGETVIGASVVVKGTTNGTITGLDGDFELSNVKKGATIQISFVGYQTAEVVWNGEPLTIELKDDSQVLDEVVVVGFGTQKKVNLTGSVSTVNADELTSRPVANVTQAMQGLVPGMNFSYGKGGGKVGNTMSINVRGTGTLDSNVSNASPLILIDGMEGDINMLNPNDIENISVLKDAAASSIYGSRAPYGVILVTTKKGKAGRVNINYNNNFSWSTAINMPKMVDSYNYAKFINQIAINDNNTPNFKEEHLQRIKDYQLGTFTQTTVPDESTPTIWDWRGNANVDWLDEIFGGTGFQQEHSLSVTGGSEKVQYFMSANYFTQNGVVRYGDENMHRYTVNGKINAQLTPWLKANYNMKFMRRDLDQPYNLDDNLFFYNTARRWPTQPVLDPNGLYLTELTKNLMWGGNNVTQTDWVTQQLQLELEPIKNWRTFIELNYKTINTMRDEARNKLTKYDINGNVYYEAGQKNSIYSYSERTNFFNTNIYSEYTHQWNNHTLKGMVGFQAELNKYTMVGAKKEDLITESMPVINVATGKEYAYGQKNHWATAGFFGRINYNYAERYLAEVNLRYDGTSRFAADKRWNLFPSFSVGWNVAREEFMEKYQDVINTLKFRGSWGQLGNQNTVSLYPYIQTMPFYPVTNTTQNTWLINGARYNGSTAPSLISALLTWETMSSWNVGFDLGMFNNRLNMSFDYFVRTTFDMVGPAPELPVTLGTAVPKVNNADMRSTGFELDLSWRDQINGFNYGIRALLSDDRQKVLKYPNESGSFQTWREGQYLNEIWGLTTVGIAKTQEEMDAHLAKVDQSAIDAGTWLAGDVMYADLNGDGKVTNGNTMDDLGDKRLLGNSTPRFKFGLDLDASWKGFDVRLFFQGVAKRDWAFAANHIVYWGNAGGVWNSAAFENNMDFYRPVGDDWLGENLDARFPRLTSSNKNRQTQTAYIENAAYVRLKNFQIGYTLPSSLTQKVGISKLRIFFSAENLFTITGLPDGIDPETLGNNSDFGGMANYPLTRTLSTGLSINF
ncbi:SusC/RagA family TonB-linked outer membrane protein [Bacteroides mediterraneensis]